MSPRPLALLALAQSLALWSAPAHAQPFAPPPFASLPAGAYGPMAVGDYDGDGDMDVLLGEGYALNLWTQYEDHGSLDFFSDPLDDEGPAGLTWVDLDNDNDLDAVATFYNKTLIYRNDGGVLTPITTNLVIADFSKVAAGDIDGDGDADLLITGRVTADATGARLYRNQGNFTFVEVPGPFIGVEGGGLQFLDADRDGDLDLVMVGATSNGSDPFHGNATVYRNDGTGAFTVWQTLRGAWLGALMVGDVDADGDLDLVIVGGNDDYTTNHSSLYLNNGAGTFTEQTSPSPGLPPLKGSAAIADYDNDGYVDLAIVDDGARRLRVFHNNRNLTFTQAVDLDSPIWGDVAFADFDRDGSVDLLVCGRGPDNGKVTLMYKNQRTTGNPLPSPPARLQPLVDGSKLELRWARGTDATTPSAALTYNLDLRRVVSGGTDTRILSPLAMTDGQRFLPQVGVNSASNLPGESAWRVTVPNGDYAFRVQAVDGNYEGSPFSAEVAFKVTGGTLLGYFDRNPSGTQNLTSLGTIDWAHWGADTSASFNHKNGANQISNIVAPAGVVRFTTAPTNYTWTGGTPKATSTGTTTGVAIRAAKQTMSFTVPASTTAYRELFVDVGVYKAAGSFTAWLDDGSPAYVEASKLSNKTGSNTVRYRVRFKAATSGHKLTVKLDYLQDLSIDGTGRVRLMAAYLK